MMWGMQKVLTSSFMVLCLLGGAAPAGAEDPIPAFAGPTPGVLREIGIPTVDLSGETERHSVVARGTPEVYHGHCDTVLLPDGKTMFTAWTVNHARLVGPLARSDDGGKTWTEPLDVPDNWHETANTPAIHRLLDPQGKARLVIFADGLDWRRGGKPPYPMHQAVSEDDGRTWTPMQPNGIQGEVPPKTVLSFDDGKRLILWSDLPGFVVQSESLDGGLTWSQERKILKIPARWGQPAVVRSPDGGQLLMLLRENSRKHHSLYSTSDDEARTWSEPKELPAALTGDRHVMRYAPDGRLVVAMRDRAKTSPTYGHYVVWVGRYEDIIEGREGEYRIKLLHNAARTEEDRPGEGNADCGYSDLERLPDGTIVATTYIKYQPGPEKNSVVNTRFTLEETDRLLAAGDADANGLTDEEIQQEFVALKDASGSADPLLPHDWDPKRAADGVLQGLIPVTAPQVKGAHDAEMVLVGERAYVVAEVNDVGEGESASRPEIYAMLSIVNLRMLSVEAVIPFARSEQVFENETLPVGACFVPRIARVNDRTLRCYFASEQPGVRQSQTWYRDFDLETGTFEPGIHKAKLKTSAGVFDMQPRHFHADAAVHGFRKPARDFGLYLFDSFKQFNGRTYVAINNFPGKQNALAVVHDDWATFEIVGHYNEPQDLQLSESAVNRLPDGTWLAICRQDGGNRNYTFTTSRDGRTWTRGEHREFVTGGDNSKPTFDRFDDLYYLGWQENTRIEGVRRSVFNVDVSRDGRTWERKFRFETPESFQYPTFREHEGVIWLCVTQGRKERIMFGRLETSQPQ
jgi:hypothetical protein